MMTNPPSTPATADSKLGLGLIFGVIMGLAAGIVLERFGAPYPASHIIGFLASIAIGLGIGQALTQRSRRAESLPSPPLEDFDDTRT